VNPQLSSYQGEGMTHGTLKMGISKTIIVTGVGSFWVLNLRLLNEQWEVHNKHRETCDKCWVKMFQDKTALSTSR
jgi:hypothetical protein